MVIIWCSIVFHFINYNNYVQGIVIKRSGQGKTGTFTIRKISNNIGVERCFPIASPMIENIEVNKLGAVRKSRIYYLRGLRGKKAKIKEAKK